MEQKVIGIELTALQELVAQVIREELTGLENRLLQANAQTEKMDDHLFTKDVAQLLDITRQTVRDYAVRRILPEPQFAVNGRPYWTRQQVIDGITKSEVGYKYPSLSSQTKEQIALKTQNQ